MKLSVERGPLYQFQLSSAPLHKDRDFPFTAYDFTNERIQPNVLVNVISANSCVAIMESESCKHFRFFRHTCLSKSLFNAPDRTTDQNFHMINFHGVLGNRENRKNYAPQNFQAYGRPSIT